MATASMKTGKLFEFSVEKLSSALHKAFAAEAIKDFDGKTEAQCGGCLHQADRLFAVAETKQQALRAINHKKLGLCGTCISELVAKQGWNIVTKSDRF